ncbi:MAG: hypothetical protein NVS2B7_34670 [Herpetosiphon sp.]
MSHRYLVAAMLLLALGTMLVENVTLRTVPPLHLPPQQSVLSRNPRIGVHLRLNGNGDERAVRDQLVAVREMGASWVVDLFPWAYIQPLGPDHYDWRGADMLIAHARRQGLQIVARLDIVPAWARPSQTSDRLLEAGQYESYAHFAAVFAERYRDEVHYVQIWNEPNLDQEWGLRTPDPGAYAALLRAVYPAVKARAPGTMVIAGSLSPGQGVPGIRMDDLQFLKEMLSAGAVFDLLGVHAYGGRAPADEAPHPDRVNFRRVEVYRDQMRREHAPHPLIVTEGGWNDHPRWNNAVTPAERARWTVDAYRISEGWDDVIAVCMWQWQLPLTHSYQDNYTFVNPDGTPKAIYYEVQKYSRN